MIAGTVMVFKKGEDDPRINEDVLIELADTEKPTIEIAFDIRNERVYLRFKLADLVRELTE